MHKGSHKGSLTKGSHKGFLTGPGRAPRQARHASPAHAPYGLGSVMTLIGT